MFYTVIFMVVSLMLGHTTAWDGAEDPSERALLDSLVENKTSSLSLSRLPNYFAVSRVMNTTAPGTVLLRYFLTMDKPDISTVVIYVRIARHNEAIVESRLWHDGTSEGDSSTQSRVEYRKTCNDLFDECFLTKHFSYGAAPGLEDARPMYTGRQAFRIDNANGEWILDIIGQLPHDGRVHIEVVLEQKVWSYWQGLTVGALSALIFIWSLISIWAFIRSRRMVEVETGNRENPDQDDEVNTTDGTAIQGLLGRGRIILYRLRPCIASVLTYRRVQQEGTDSAPGQPSDSLGVAVDQVEEEAEDPDRICRICRTSAPIEDLFAPCKCNGTMRYIHRACLQKWRESTTNPANKIRCSECHATFRIIQTEKTMGFVTHMATKIVLGIGFVGGAEVLVLTLGYVLKALAFVVTFGQSSIDWSPFSFYHHFIGVVIIASAMYNMVIVVDPLCDAFLWSFRRPARRLFVAASLLLNIPLGYIAKYVIWAFTTVPWDWTVSYASGFTLLVLMITYMLPSVQRVYLRWASSHRDERVEAPRRNAEGEEMAPV